MHEPPQGAIDLLASLGAPVLRLIDVVRIVASVIATAARPGARQPGALPGFQHLQRVLGRDKVLDVRRRNPEPAMSLGQHGGEERQRPHITRPLAERGRQHRPVGRFPLSKELAKLRPPPLQSRQVLQPCP